MADHTPVNLPDDVDALLRQAMAIEPEPQFAARVRQRIDLEPQKSHWRWTSLFAAGSAAAALVLAIVVPLGLNDDAMLPAPPAAPPLPVESARVQEPRIEPDRARVVPQRVTAGRAVPAFDFPPVIVDPRQRAALNALARFGSQGAMPEDVLAKLTAAPASVPPAITVEPLVVSPIGIGGVLHYESERR